MMVIRVMGKTKEVAILDALPDGWRVLAGATTAPAGYMWVSNNKSYWDRDRRTALIKEAEIEADKRADESV